MTRRPTVLLFDIDGTLLSSSGAGRRAMERAMAEVTGRDGLFPFRFDGLTDRAIVRRALASVRPPDEGTIDEVLTAYLRLLAQELHTPGDYHVYPGVIAALEATRSAPGFAVGLGTGNIRRGAALKLGRVGLAGYFDFGGFGCDHEERAEILRTGADRGAEHLGVERAACRVVVIGDTPHDIAAAQTIGAQCLGVATGRFSATSLLEAGAHVAVADLRASGALELLLGG